MGEIDPNGRKKVSFSVILVVMSLIIIVCFSIWFLKRMGIGDMRHSLNNPDISKDEIGRVLDSCSVKNKTLVISKGNKNYIESDLRYTDLIYRYLVVDDEILEYANCMKALAVAISNQKYGIQITVSREGKKILGIDNLNREKL